MNEELTLEGTEDFSLREIEDAGPRIERRWRKEWKTITEKIDILMRGATRARVIVVCGDGQSVTFEFRPDDVKARRPIETVQIPEGGAPGECGEVEVADVIDLIWQHGGVDLAASRTATRGRSENE